MDSKWHHDENKSSALSCYYIAKNNTVVSRISGVCQSNIFTLKIGALVEAKETLADGSLKIKVHDSSKDSYWEKTEWRCQRIDVIPVPEIVWHFLAAVQVPQERVRLAIDFDFCEDASKLKEKSNVWYRPDNNTPVKYRAVITYIGQVHELGQGFRFGLELLVCLFCN